MPDFESLYNECQANAFTAAKKRFYDNKVGDITESEMGGKTIISAVVRGHRDYRTRIIFDEQGGLYDYSCDCYGFNLSDGPCKHIIATALTYEEKNPQSEVVKVKHVSDGCVQGLISSYAKMRRGRVLRDETPASLVPVLGLAGDDSLTMRFVIGKKRMYKLRDINEFCLIVHGGQYHRYGSALAFEHTLDNFDDKSRPLVSFLLKTVKEKSEQIKDRIVLSPSDFDDFVDIYDGLIEVEEGGASEGMRQIVRQPDALKAEINVATVEGGYSVSSGLKTFKLLSGKRYDYIMTPNRIYRVTDEYVEASYKLLKLLNAREKIFVSDMDIARFYNNVICEAEKFSVIKSDTDLTRFTVPQLKAALYLDREGGVVKGRLECSYGDTDVDIFAEPFGDRDYEAESALKECLEAYFPFFPHLVLESDEAVYNLLTEGMRRIRRLCAVYMTAEMQKISVRKPPGVKVGVKLSGDLINIDIYDDDFTYEELIKIINAAQSNKYIRLGDSFIDLDDPGLKALSEVMQLNSSLTLPAYYAPRVTEELKEFYDVSASGCEKLLDFENVNVTVPPELDSVLRPYQKTGLKWLSALKDNGFGGILADDMGLGKSLQIIALILAHKLKTIIVCPTTLILNWESEFKKFAPHLNILCVMGSQEERAILVEKAGEYDVVITSYELIRRDIEQYKMEFDLAVIDEAQYIKNPETKNARAVKALKSKHRFALTGTPIENSLSELWSIFDFLMPGYLFTYAKFKETFEIKIVGGDTKAAEELRRFVMPFVLRRLKSDVLTELPPKIETDIVAPLTGEQADYYKAHLSLIRKSLIADPNVNKITVLTMLTKLRRICCDPSLEDHAYKGNSAKMEACMQLVDSAIKGGHKTLIFSQFTSMLDIIRAELLTRGITNYMLTGDTPKAERMKFVNRFNKDETQVFLISLRAGGTGLNLTGADVVIHYDPWWNLSVMNQATDRAYRIGQQKSVQVYSLLLDGTLEQKIVELQKRKAKLSGLLEGNLEVSELLSLIQ
ncbi:MAG: DEAD/DEAH box helicase [Clostridiales bacterium]|nr:DEAD/DEAH box helicase [Clostridiales bacterium]